MVPNPGLVACVRVATVVVSVDVILGAEDRPSHIRIVWEVCIILAEALHVGVSVPYIHAGRGVGRPPAVFIRDVVFVYATLGRAVATLVPKAIGGHGAQTSPLIAISVAAARLTGGRWAVEIAVAVILEI